jgi:hypothetical protein
MTTDPFEALGLAAAGLDFFFHMFFLVKYSKSLEEGSFRNRSADFLWMLLFGSGILIAAAPWVNIQFLGSSLTFMMVRQAKKGCEVVLFLIGATQHLRVPASVFESRICECDGY